VVESDPQLAERFSALLSARGYEPVVARSGEEAMAAARARAPDAAVVDLELPDLDGAALVARLRQSVRDLPAIGCGGERPEEAAEAGFTAVHRKPLDLPSLVRAVDGLLRRLGPPS
jgi:two-component system OmpR family response regulator